MSSRNAQQVKDWNGRSGESWVVHQDWLDRMLAPFGDAAIAAAAPVAGEHVLDIGCGAGTTSFAIADRVRPGGGVLGIDISQPLIGRARELERGTADAAFLLADAGTADLPAQHFDLLFSRFGVMFFDDPVAVFTHLRGALKPSGRLTLACWRAAEENDWIRLPMGAVQGIVPPAPPLPPDAPGPFSFGSRERVAAILERAGFADIAFTPFDHDIVFGQGPDREAAVENALSMAFEIGPLSRVLADEPDAVRERASHAVRAAFARHAGERSVLINGAAWIVGARNSVGGSQ